MDQLMEGMTVLSQEEIPGIKIEFGVGFIMLGLLCLIIASIVYVHCYEFNIVTFAFATTASLLIVMGIVLCVQSRNTHTEYKVTVDPDVSFVEFNEKYDVVDQEGKIYTIVKKEVKHE